MKSLNGKELAGFVKERQAHQVRSLKTRPKLLIIRDNENPIIQKYVDLKIRYGEDIGVIVTDYLAKDTEDIKSQILSANSDPTVDGIIIQLPLTDKSMTEELCNLIAPTKDVDGLGQNAAFDSATATAINWLLAGYDIKLDHQKIALVGRGKLVGAPLYRMFTNSGFDVALFHHGSDLTKLNQYDIIITATGVPGLIVNSMVKPGAVLVDAGTASEKGVIKGDLAPEVRERQDLSAITPTIGGVGPLTVSCLFDHVIAAHQTNNQADTQS
ncbi:MAG: bifunctional 5,10-methylenetetrahydrofolate dehydrogenase/5,10-methenyltetrahydrofolate cyclohydrolase [Candidatus Saccharibacteria bacterium]|nr:bifunctional 5,10-methylenetetrahydrofolate dehydrogenase/5,10-methenyltetrahydrofolate cyclohydrolase [Candidatus Saccharibacteria bacterium]